MGDINIIEIEKMYNAFTDGFIKSDDSSSLATDLIHKEFSSYIEGISDFFVTNKANVERIYHAIHNNTHRYNKIKFLNVKEVTKVFNSYKEGLESYIWKIVDVRDSDQIPEEKINDVINKISEKNASFVDELFRNVFPEYDFNEEGSIDDAMFMVENLLDVREDMKGYLTTIDEMNSKSSTDYERRAVKVYIDALRNFVMRSIKSSIDCYNQIIIALDNRTSVLGDNKPEQYKIF